MKNFKTFWIILLTAVITFTLASCGNGTTGGGGPGGNNNTGNNNIAVSIPSFVSTDTSDYAYELMFESTTASRAVHAPKEGGKYSLIVYGANDGKVKGVSEGSLKVTSGGLTLTPESENETDITVTINDGEMTQITGKTGRGNHTLPGGVKPFKQDTGESGGLNYAVNPGGTVTITGYGGNGGAVTIPEKINGKTVIGIGMYTFYERTSITSVTIPNSVTSIGYGAFEGCTSLASVTMGNSVESFGRGAFYNCKSLTSINIPGSITSLGDWTFGWCEKLTSVTIENGVASIGGYYVFTGCGLTSVIIPDGVTGIGYQAFSNCTSLTSITIPDSVKSIGDGAFAVCTSLKSVTIPDGVTSIGYQTFYGCNSLTSITIPDIRKIAYFA